MTDIANLSFSIDSSGLDDATRALDRNADAAEEASGSAQILEREYQNLSRTASSASSVLSEQDARYRSIAQRAMEWAEASRTANMSERALADHARDATSALTAQEMVIASMGTEQERMTRRVEQMARAEARVAQQQEAAARATRVREVNLRQLLGQIDPTIAKLEQLAELEGRLEQARDLGLIRPEIFDQYQQKLDETRAATLNVGQASDIMTKSIGGLNLQAVQTQQSIASLARALVTGQWGQAQASITSLTARTGSMGGAFTAAGLAITGTGAAVLGFTVLAAKGYVESRKLEGVILAMGDASGFTTGQLLNMRNELGRTTGQYKDATTAINQLVLGGKATGDVLQSIAAASVDIARLTGQSIGGIVSEVQSLVDGGEDALLRLNDKYKFLTLATYEHITALRDQKGDFEANKVAAEELQRVMADRAQQMVDSAGYVEKAWKGVVNVFNTAIQAATDFGRSDLDAKIERLQREIQVSSVNRDGVVQETAYTKALREQLDVLQEKKRRTDLMAQSNAANAKWHADAIAVEAEAEKAREAAEKSIARRIEGIDKESAKLAARNRIIEEFSRLADDDSRHFDGSQERLLAASDKAIDDRFAKKGAAAAKAAERLESRLRRGSDAIEKFIRQWQTTLDGTGSKVMDDFARRIDFIQEKVAEFERLKLPAGQIRAFEQEMTALAEAIREKEIAEYLRDFNHETAEMTAFLTPGADAVLRFEDAVYQLNKEMAAGHLTAEAYAARLEALAIQRDRAAIAMLNSIEDEIELIGMSAKDQEVWNNLKMAGVKAESAFGREIIQSTRELQEYREAMMDQIEAMDAVRNAGRSLLSDLARGENPLSALESALDRVHKRITDMISENLMDQLLGKRGDAGGGKFGDWLGGLFGDLFGVDQGAANEAAALSKSAAELTASGTTLLGAATALSASAAALAAAGGLSAGSGFGGDTAFGTGSYSGGGSGGGIWASLFSAAVSAWGGGRAWGGDVREDRMYRVGEFNRPELLNLGRGQQYLIPGDHGRVEPMGAPVPAAAASVNQKIYVQGKVTNDTARQLANKAGQRQRIAAARFGG